MSRFNDLLFELRTWDTDRLRVERERVIVERRKLRTRELALTQVLDERAALPADQPAKDGETEAEARRTLELAKKLEHLPNLGNAAMDGQLSDGQLEPAVALADEDSDEELAASAPHTSPLDLQQRARAQRAKPKREDSVARRNRRSLWKRRDDDGYLVGGFVLPMEHGGAIVESFFDLVTERMRPKTGEAWEPLERRQADVLIGLCQLEADAAGESGRDEHDRATGATLGVRVDVHVDVPMDGPATMCGVLLPDEWVDAARANARVHLRVLDDNGNVVHEERARSFVSEKRRRAVVRRDGRCRWPGCQRRLRLQVHHLQPRSWGGTDDIANLAAVCPYHHGLLVPHGDHVLEGNPNTPDGLTLRHLTKEERERQRFEEAA